MGIAYVDGIVRVGRGKGTTVRFMVDTGALYTVLPARLWHALRLKPARTLELALADGSTITRGVSECRIELAGRSATSPVVLGEADDGPLLGAVTLETLALMVNPLTRRVIPLTTVPLGAVHAGHSPSIFAM
jgi:predicted aspartyl protease